MNIVVERGRLLDLENGYGNHGLVHIFKWSFPKILSYVTFTFSNLSFKSKETIFLPMRLK